MIVETHHGTSLQYKQQKAIAFVTLNEKYNGFCSVFTERINIRQKL